MPYDHTRGTMEEWDDARSNIASFKETMRRQDPAFYNTLRMVEAYCRLTRPFFKKRYTEWLSVYQDAWTKALSDKTTFFYGGTANPIRGLQATGVIIDDPMNETQSRNPKVKAALKKLAKKTYSTVGVRFLRGHNLEKCYTYKVPKKTKLRLGEEVVVPSLVDGYTANGIAVVVELHSTPQDTQGYDYKFVAGRIARITQ